MNEPESGLHQEWLTVLYILLSKMHHSGGALAIEGDIGSPSESPLFLAYPKTLL